MTTMHEALQYHVQLSILSRAGASGTLAGRSRPLGSLCLRSFLSGSCRRRLLALCSLRRLRCRASPLSALIVLLRFAIKLRLKFKEM